MQLFISSFVTGDHLIKTFRSTTSTPCPHHVKHLSPSLLSTLLTLGVCDDEELAQSAALIPADTRLIFSGLRPDSTTMSRSGHWVTLEDASSQWQPLNCCSRLHMTSAMWCSVSMKDSGHFSDLLICYVSTVDGSCTILLYSWDVHILVVNWMSGVHVPFSCSLMLVGEPLL